MQVGARKSLMTGGTEKEQTQGWFKDAWTLYICAFQMWIVATLQPHSVVALKKNVCTWGMFLWGETLGASVYL